MLQLLSRPAGRAVVVVVAVVLETSALVLLVPEPDTDVSACSSVSIDSFRASVAVEVVMVIKWSLVVR